MNLLLSEEAMNFKARCIALASALKIEDFETLIIKYILKHWQDSWDQQIYEMNCTKYIP
jgi:hypothetical protein